MYRTQTAVDKHEPYKVRYVSYLNLGNGYINLFMIQNVMYVVHVNVYFAFCSKARELVGNSFCVEVLLIDM